MTAIVQAGANQPLSFTVGDDVSLRLTVTENSVAYSWTGATVTTSIIANGAAVATNFTTATSAGGILDLSLTDTETTTLGIGTFDYWVKVTKASVTSTWVAGQLTMHAAQYGSASNLSSSLSITTAASTTLAITLSGATSAYNVAARTLLQAPKVMATPPTLGAAVTATAIVSPQIRQTSKGATSELDTTFFSTPVGGAWAKQNTTFPQYNFTKTALPSTGYGSTRLTIEFVVDCLAFEFMYNGQTANYRVWVDGELVSATPTAVPADNAQYWKPVTFGTRAVRHILIEADSGFKFGGVTIGPNDAVMPSTVRRPKCLLIGDSFTEGSGATARCLGFPFELASRLGWDIWAQGQGGSGYTAVGSYTGNFGSRIAAHAAIPFDIVMFAGGINDATAQTTLQADAEAAFALAKTTWPEALVVATSPLINKGVEGWGVGTYIGLLNKIKTAATNQNVMFVDVMEMPYAGNTAVSGTFTSTHTAGGTSVLSSVSFPVGGTIELSTGLSNVERRVVTAASGASSPYTLTIAASGFGHTSGETITQVGNCLWTGTGRVGATTGTGNCDLYVSSDGVHPSDAGHAAIGSALAHAITHQLKVASQ